MIDSHRDEIAKLEALYAMNPEGRVFTHLAEACRKAGQLDRAKQILEEGLQKHPDYASAHVVLGRVLVDSNEPDAAIAEFRRVLELDRHNLIALRSLGELAVARDATDEAIHYYSELAVLDPSDPEIQGKLRDLRESGGEGEGAEGGPARASAETAAQASGATVEEPAPETGTQVEAGLAGEPHRPVFESEVATADPSASDEAGPADSESAGPEPEPLVAEGEIGEIEYGTLAGLESTSLVDVDAALEEATQPAADLSDRAAAEPEQPGEHPPIDEAAWREIGLTAVGSEPTTGSTEPADEDSEPADEDSEPAGEDSEVVEAAAYATPDLTDAAADETGVERHEDDTAELAGAGEAGEAGEREADRDVEGRWQAPEPVTGDAQAERDRPADHSAEWIPSDRWEWVAASADTSDESSREAEPDRESGDESGPAEAEAGAPYDEETSFAGLMSDDEESGEDTFGEGAAAVLDAFAAETDELTVIEEDTPESGPEIAADETEEVESGSATISWITDAEDEGDQVITETLAEIYASQGLYDRAAGVYRRLIEARPDDDRLRARLADLESATGWAAPEPEKEEGTGEEEREAFLERVESAWTGGEGAAGIEDSPYLWTEQASGEPEGPRIGEYFASLLAWRPTEPVPSVPEIENATPEEEGDWHAASAELETEPEAEPVGREGEEDLEMFRSWLKSLKK